MSLPIPVLDLIRNNDGLFPTEKLSGMYRAIVKDNKDPDNRFRLKVLIPGIHPDDAPTKSLPWADCCSQIAGFKRLVMKLPKNEDVVWVSFEMGYKTHPIWMGSWFGKTNGQNDIPTENQSKPSDHYVIRTESGNTIDISEELTNVSITIKSARGSEIVLNDTLDTIIIKPSITGSVKIGNNATIPCNDLPTCPLLGPHSIGTVIPGSIVLVP
jgi:hypothetical protein